MANKDANFVGIIALKDTALDQPGIVRLGPPPGNAGILIRGGAGWVFDRPKSREIRDPRIIPQDFKPTYDEVAFALAREMAWRWFYGRDRRSSNVVNSKRRGVPEMTRNLVSYAEIEAEFVEQFLTPSIRSGLARTAAEPRELAQGVECACVRGTSCCGGTCRSCEETGGSPT